MVIFEILGAAQQASSAATSSAGLVTVEGRAAYTQDPVEIQKLREAVMDYFALLGKDAVVFRLSKESGIGISGIVMEALLEIAKSSYAATLPAQNLIRELAVIPKRTALAIRLFSEKLTASRLSDLIGIVEAANAILARVPAPENGNGLPTAEDDSTTLTTTPEKAIWPWILGGVGVLGLLGIVAYALTRDRE